jgi:hypothetical protein
MSHPPGDTVHMKRKSPFSAAISFDVDRKTVPLKSGRREAGASKGGANGSVKLKAVEGGLLRFCHEVAGLIIRRHLSGIDPETVRLEVTERLIGLMKCSEERAARLVDLSLELIHVKMHGKFERNPLELSLLIARAGNQLRDVSNN